MFVIRRGREQEVDERRDRDAWEREKDNRYYDEHMSVDKKANDSYKPHVNINIFKLLLVMKSCMSAQKHKFL